jgi:hypothetical protein
MPVYDISIKTCKMSTRTGLGISDMGLAVGMSLTGLPLQPCCLAFLRKSKGVRINGAPSKSFLFACLVWGLIRH